MSQVASIWRRDKRRCHICGRAVPITEASRDHVEPRSAGGYDKAANYRLAHRACNSARGSLPMDLVDRVIRGLDHPSPEQIRQALYQAQKTVAPTVSRLHRSWCDARARYPRRDVARPCNCGGVR